MIDDETEPSERDRERGEIQRYAGFLRRALQFWPTLLLALGLSAGVALVLLQLIRPQYRSETVILYSQGVGSVDAAEQGNARNATARLKELLLSRRELSRIVTAFGLYPDVRDRYGAEDAVDELKRHLEFRAPGGDTFSIAFQGGSPSEAQRVTSALGKMVIDGDAKLRETQAEFARKFLATEKTSKADALRDAEQGLAAFMAEHRRFALDTTPLAAGAAIRATLPTAVPSAAGQPQWARGPAARFRPVGSDQVAPAASLPAVTADAGERARAVAAVAAARANLAEQLGRFTPAHPDVRAAQGALERAMTRLEALGPEPRLTPADPAPVAAAAPTKVEARAPSQRAATPLAAPVVAPIASSAPGERPPSDAREDVVKLETEWLRLTRGVTEARQRLDQVEAALFKADILASSERSGSGVQLSVIDPAYLPQRPLGLSRTLIVASCLAAGLVFGLVIVALRAAFDDRILQARDLARVGPVLVQIPRLSWRGRFHGAA